MRRFQVPSARVGEALLLPPPESRHALRVLRLKSGDRVGLFNGSGSEWIAEVTGTEDPVRLLVLEEAPALTGSAITVAAACPKGDRLEFMVQKMAELGASRFLPVRFQRSVVPMTRAKRDRLQRVAEEASKQCGRADVLHIEEECPLTDLAESRKPPRLLLALPKAERSLVEAATLPATIVIGPEGGLTPEEETLLIRAGAVTVRLASTTLRIETAAITAVALLQALTPRKERS